MPARASHGEMHPVECLLLDNVLHPQLARLSEDAEMAPFVKANQLVLLDYSEPARRAPKPGIHYAACINGRGAIRVLIKEGSRLFAATERTRGEREQWQEL